MSQASAARIAELEQQVAHESRDLEIVEDILDNYMKAMDRMEDRLRNHEAPFESGNTGENRFSGIDEMDELGEWILELIEIKENYTMMEDNIDSLAMKLCEMWTPFAGSCGNHRFTTDDDLDDLGDWVLELAIQDATSPIRAIHVPIIATEVAPELPTLERRIAYLEMLEEINVLENWPFQCEICGKVGAPDLSSDECVFSMSQSMEPAYEAYEDWCNDCITVELLRYAALPPEPEPESDFDSD